MLGGITVQRWLQASGGGAVVAHLDKRERERYSDIGICTLDIKLLRHTVGTYPGSICSTDIRLPLHPSPSSHCRSDGLCKDLLPAPQEAVLAGLLAPLDGGCKVLLSPIHVLLETTEYVYHSRCWKTLPSLRIHTGAHKLANGTAFSYCPAHTFGHMRSQNRKNPHA